jgi:hypothetical protein
MGQQQLVANAITLLVENSKVVPQQSIAVARMCAAFQL